MYFQFLLERLKKKWLLLIPVITVSLSAFVVLIDPVVLRASRHAVFDQYQRWHPRDYQEGSVRIIDIDDDSLRKFGQWPWPRSRIAELTRRLQDAGVAAIGFDMVFPEADRTSPSSMLGIWKTTPEIRAQLEQLPDHDALFADALLRGRVVLGFAPDRKESIDTYLPLVKARFVELNAPAMPFVPPFTGSVRSLPSLVTAAQGHGGFAFVPDADGVVRRVPTLLSLGETLYPSLATEILRVALNAQNITTRTVEGHGLEEVRIGKVALPTSPNGEVWMYYSEPAPERTIPAWKVLDGTTSDSELSGKLIVVGTSAPGLMDLRFSALGTIIPGVEIHAQLLEQALDGPTLQRPQWSEAVEVVLLVAGGLLVGGVALGFGAVPSLGVFLLMLAGTWGAAWLAFRQGNLLLDAAAPSLAFALTFVVSSIVRHVGTERRQRWVKQAFSRYVSPNLVEHLVAHPEALKLSGERQQCSFLFTDLEGFTALMETMDPAAAVSLVNRYLDGLIAIAFAHDGTLTRIVGDGLAILFSAPIVQDDHPMRAVRCALAMQKFAHQYAAELQAQGIAFGQTRMGVHLGEVIVGNFGGSTILDYRALGDPINTASRLEGANRYLGTLVCVSQAVLAQCPSFAARPIGRLLLKGKQQPIMVFEPLDMTTTPDADYRQAFERMRSVSSDALAAFERLAQERPADRLVAMHLARLRSGESGDLLVMEGK